MAVEAAEAVEGTEAVEGACKNCSPRNLGGEARGFPAGTAVAGIGLVSEQGPELGVLHGNPEGSNGRPHGPILRTVPVPGRNGIPAHR